ncbi:MAG TPA: sulfate ABC transporter permease subunit CysT [Tepidisphaeraceae bacterium]|jgi:sulfate transport system permease protein
MSAASQISKASILCAPARRIARRDVLPGKRLALGYTLTYLSLIVLLPLAGLVLKTAQLSWADFWNTVWSDPFVRASYRLSFQAAAAAAILNSFFGLIVAWVLVRYRFPGRRLFDAVVDFPFALPTAVAGLTFASLYGNVHWIDQVRLGTWITRAASKLGAGLSPDALSGLDQFRVIVMLMFVGLPFVVRSVQSVLQDWDVEAERAAVSLGAGRWMTFRRVVFPELMPAWLSGLALAFARAVGEYGSVIFVAGNIPGQSEIAPLRIMTKLDDFRYAEATAIAVVLLGTSLLVLLFINGLEWFSRRHERA